jgi:F0F1-type ATP synthase assembly protein I
VTTIPMILVAGPLVGYWIGVWLDSRFGIDPWGKVIVSLLGFVASLKQVVSIIQRWIKETEKD